MKTNKEIAQNLRSSYSLWKVDSLENAGYFVIFNGFVENGKLKDISGNALKLYIYLGVYANNKSGEVWHSNRKIAKYFNKSERTIRLWFQELESLNLVRKMQLQYDGESHMFLQPYPSYGFYETGSDKYIYTYRLKNKSLREKVNLLDYQDELANILEQNFKPCFVNVKKDRFTIRRYTDPITNTSLRKVNSLINDNCHILKIALNAASDKADILDDTTRYIFEHIRKPL